jgi:hypothetical protein
MPLLPRYTSQVGLQATLQKKKKKFQATLLKKKKIPAEALQVATKLFLKLFSELLNLKKKRPTIFSGKRKGKGKIILQIFFIFII